jgi:hypothetical protein
MHRKTGRLEHADDECQTDQGAFKSSDETFGGLTGRRRHARRSKTGDGAAYLEGDRITVCVAANVPTIAIYPPPPPPTIRVESMVDGSSRVFLEDRFTDGQRCLSGIIVPPFGQETVRAQAIRADGTSFLEDSVAFATRPR